MENMDNILIECLGLHKQILLRNYQDSKSKVKHIFIALIRMKLLEIDPEYDDEVNYFLKIMELFIDKDFKIRKSLEIS